MATALKDPISREITQIIKNHKHRELPKNTRRKNGHQIPLFAWLRGTPKKYIDEPGGRIGRLLSENPSDVQFPFVTLGSAKDLIIERIGRRFKPTDLQYAEIYSLLVHRYRGRCRPPTYFDRIDGVDRVAYRSLAGENEPSSESVIRWWRELIEELRPIPLAACIDQRVADLIVLKALGFALSDRGRKDPFMRK